MFIKVNNEYILEIKEDNLIVQDKKLYNKLTKEYEGVSGDIASFDYNNGKNIVDFKGTIDTYTNGDTIPIRGGKEPYKAKKKHITHISVVTEYLDTSKELLIASE